METSAVSRCGISTTIRRVRSRNAISKLEQALEIKNRLEKEGMTMAIEVIQELLKENNGDVDMTLCISRELACGVDGESLSQERIETLVEDVLNHLEELVQTCGSSSNDSMYQRRPNIPLDTMNPELVRDVLVYNGLNVASTKHQLECLLLEDGHESDEQYIHKSSHERLIEMASDFLPKTTLEQIWMDVSSSIVSGKEDEDMVLDRCLSRVIAIVQGKDNENSSELILSSADDSKHENKSNDHHVMTNWELTCEDVFEIGSPKHSGIIQLREMFLETSDAILISAFVNNEYDLESTIASLLNFDDSDNHEDDDDIREYQGMEAKKVDGVFSFADVLRKEPRLNFISPSHGCIVNGNGNVQTGGGRWQSLAPSQSPMSTRSHWSKFRILHIYAAIDLLKENNPGIDIRLDSKTGSIEFYGFKSQLTHSSWLQIDFHGLLVMEAINLCRKILRFYRHSKHDHEIASNLRKNVAPFCTICFIVGRGAHSAGGRSRLKPALTRFLMADEECSAIVKKIDLSNEGLISVRI